jgi:hypothetical protein
MLMSYLMQIFVKLGLTFFYQSGLVFPSGKVLQSLTIGDILACLLGLSYFSKYRVHFLHSK